MNESGNKQLVSYLAGIFDVRGYIGLTKYRRKPEYYSIQLEINMHTEEIPRLFQLTFGGKYYQRITQKQEWSGLYRWYLHNRPMIKVALDKLYPYLILKKPQAETMLDYINKHSFSTGLGININTLTPDLKTHRKVDSNKLKQLKLELGSKNNRLIQTI